MCESIYRYTRLIDWLAGCTAGSLDVHVELVVLGFGRLSDLGPAVALVFRLVVLVLGRWRMIGSVHLVLVIVMVEGALVALHQVTWNIFWWCVGERWVAQVHQEGALVHNLCAWKRKTDNRESSSCTMQSLGNSTKKHMERPGWTNPLQPKVEKQILLFLLASITQPAIARYSYLVLVSSLLAIFDLLSTHPISRRLID